MNLLRYAGRFLSAGLLPYDQFKHDVVSKDTKTYKKYQEEQEKLTNETGWDRMKQMFNINEFGEVSPELSSILTTSFSSFLIGLIYGGVIHSREAYLSFMENNEATAFASHLDAKRKLQNDVTTSFAKGGIRWAWRIAFFTTSYYGIVTIVSVYRGESSIYEYLAAGSITGAAFKMNMGLRGMAAGGILGGALGGIAGCVSLLLLSAAGMTMKDARYWHHKWHSKREEHIQQAYKKINEDVHKTPDIIKKHDAKVGETLSLESVK